MPKKKKDLEEQCDLYVCDNFHDNPPKEVLKEWSEAHIPEPTLENKSFYVAEDGKMYFYCGNTRIKVEEHFDTDGKPMEELVESVVKFSAKQ